MATLRNIFLISMNLCDFVSIKEKLPEIIIWLKSRNIFLIYSPLKLIVSINLLIITHKHEVVEDVYSIGKFNQKRQKDQKITVWKRNEVSKLLKLLRKSDFG